MGPESIFVNGNLWAENIKTKKKGMRQESSYKRNKWPKLQMEYTGYPNKIWIVGIGHWDSLELLSPPVFLSGVKMGPYL